MLRSGIACGARSGRNQRNIVAAPFGYHRNCRSSCRFEAHWRYRITMRFDLRASAPITIPMIAMIEYATRNVPMM